jgi:hypothetical protein
VSDTADQHDRRHRGTVRYDRAPTIRDGDSLSGSLDADHTGRYTVTDKYGHVVGGGAYHLGDDNVLVYDTWDQWVVTISTGPIDGEQSGRGRVESVCLRDAQRPALGGTRPPDDPGAAPAGAAADGAGERGDGVPSRTTGGGSVPDYGDDAGHDHPRPYFHDHEHRHADGDGRAFPPTPRHGHIHTEFFEHHTPD